MGVYLKRVSRSGGNNVASPWNAWVEEAMYHEIERDRYDALLVSTPVKVWQSYDVFRVRQLSDAVPLMTTKRAHPSPSRELCAIHVS